MTFLRAIELPKRGLRNRAATEASSLSDPAPIGEATRTWMNSMPSHAASKPRFTYASGDRLLDRFTVQRGIGTGGFGDVYFALSDAGKEVALKQIQRHLEIELRGVSHCLNLKHPHLVSIHDVCRDADGGSWIVMEYVAGPNLRDQLDDSPGGLGRQESLRWFAGMAAGVQHLHDEGLVHRDLKPGNLFDDRGVVKVGDYGLSKYISESRRGGNTESIGTFHYMAPEIARGEYGREIDIYALGVVLYEMLTGELPFDGESSHEIIMKHMTATPDLSRIEPPFQQVIERALLKDPKRRWGSVREMANASGLELQPGQFGSPLPVATVVSPSPRASHNARPVTATAAPSSPTATAPIPAGKIPQVAGPPSAREPLARAVEASIDDFRAWWRELRVAPPVKTLLVLLAVFVFVVNTRWLLPLLSILGLVYVPYYILRQMLIGPTTAAVPYQEARALAAAAASKNRPMPYHRWRKYKRIRLASKRSSTQLAELSGSLTAATIATVFCAVFAAVVGIRNGDVTSIRLAPYFWAASTVLAAATVTLGLGKLWEASEGDPLRRRTALLGVGGGVGAFCFLVGRYLMVPLNVGLERSIDATELPQALFATDGTPLVSAFMVHFALLMATIRWWRVCDPLRSSRLSLGAVAIVVIGDWMVQQLVPIPQPWGMMIAAGTVIAVQIAAPWENPQERETLQDSPQVTGEVA